jgi:putative membrane protein
MRDMRHYGPALLLGLACTLGACSKGSSGADTTAAAAATTPDTSAGRVAAPAESAGTSAGASATGTMSAANIASMIAATNGAEIAAAKLAERKASSADVKAFARQMITDHTAMEKSLDSLAKAKSITPQAPSQEDQMKQQNQTTMASLDSAKGSAFDKAYINAQVQAHQQAVTDLQNFSSQSPDPDLKALVDKALPKVQGHLDKAQQIQSKQSTGTDSSGAH